MKKLLGRFKERASVPDAHGSSSHSRRAIDVAPQVIIASARSLVEGIEQILFDSDSLSGEDMSGFHKLVKLIESPAHSEEIHIISGSRGVGSVSILLKYANHAQFVDCCAQVSLAPALLHALRLLRMLEVKSGKSAELNADGNEETSPQEIKETTDNSNPSSVSRLSSDRVCQLLVVLCGSSQVMEQLRPSLTKLLCLPMSPMPISGVHFQASVAQIVHSICRSGLTSPIVWALRDSQTMLQMTRALKELTTMPDSDKNTQRDFLLKGSKAEEHGMWVVATGSIVELLNAADAYSPVLLTDFESAGGFDLLVHICLHSSASRSMLILNSIIILLAGDAVDKPLLHPHVGVVLEKILRSVICLAESSIHENSSAEELMHLCQNISDSSSSLNKMEYILQNMSYSLLTLYSSHPQNYALVESAHFLLPMLTLCLPVLREQEAFSAVLKVLDFVCSERCDKVCIKTFCTAVAVLTKKCIENAWNDSNDDILLGHFSQIVVFTEEVVCRDTDYSICFLKNGLQSIFYESFNEIPSVQKCKEHEGLFNIFQNLINLVVTIVRKFPKGGDEVVKSGVANLSLNLISSQSVQALYSQLLLALPERLAVSDHAHYEPTLMSLIEAILSLGKERDVAHLEKVKNIVDSIGRILHHGYSDASSVWCSVHGFESVIYVVDSLENSFATSDNIEKQKSFECLASVIECLSIALVGTSLDTQDSAHENRVYFRRMIKYPKLSDAILKTHIFSSEYSERSVDLLFCLVHGQTRFSALFNPDAYALILDVLPYLDIENANSAIHRIKEFILSQIDGCQLFSDAGLVRVIVQKYHAVLRDRNNPLQPAFFDLLQSVCQEYLTSTDFKHLFVHLVKPDAVSQEKGSLPPVWKMTAVKGSDCSTDHWQSLEMLAYLAESPGLAFSSPYMLLGREAIPKYLTQENDKGESFPAHLHMQWSENQMGKPFPFSSFSFAAWVQLGSSCQGDSNQDRGGTIPMFALQGGSGGTFELQFDAFSSNARFTSQARGGRPKTQSFSVPYINENAWHLVVISMKKQKKIIKAAQVGLELFFDGQVIYSEKFDADKIPIHGPVIDIYVGKSVVGLPAGQHKNDSERKLDFCNYLKLWHLGPVLLFEEALNQIQVSRIMTKGPSYTGNFQGDSPLEGSLSTRVTEILKRCNSTFLDMDALLSALGLSGLETLVFFPRQTDPEGSVNAHLFEELPPLPVPVMAYNANSSFILKSKQPTSSQSLRIGLHNSSSDFSITPHAELVNGWYFSRMDSVSRCLSTLGGPSLLLPLLQASSTESHIVMTIDLLRHCLSNESTNLNYMHKIGYSVLAFLLSRKAENMITEKVFDAMFNMAVDRGLKTANSSVFSILLVDSIPLVSLILNHQIWDPMKPRFAGQIVALLKSLVCEDARHGPLNAQRLASVGVGKWILMFLVFILEEYTGKEFSPSRKDERSMGSDGTSSSSRSNRSMSVPPMLEGDEGTGFKYLIQTSVYILRAMLMESLLRDDIELISKIIATSYTFKDMSKSESFSSYDYLRVSLLRALSEIFSHHMEAEMKTGKSAVGHIFCSIFTPAWFLSVLEKARDVLTISNGLALLGSILQTEPHYRKSFCKHDSGLKMLNAILTSEGCVENDLSVVLPLLALFFQIPFKFIPPPDDATLPMLLTLMERCSGPLVNDSDAKDFTIPILSILLSSFSRVAREFPSSNSSKPEAPAQNVVISGMLRRAMSTAEFNGMRDIMQHRAAIDILAAAVLMSSNACDEYGTRFLSSDGVDIEDLTVCLQEDYIDIEKPQLSNCRIISQDESVSDGPISEVSVVSKGEDLLELVEMLLKNAIFKYSNPHVVYFLFLAFPCHMSERYVCGYQVLVIDIVKTVLQSVFEEMDLDALQAVCDAFTLLIPLAKANFFHKSVLADILSINLYGLDAIASPEAANWLGLEKHSAVLRDMGSSARTFSMLSIHKVLNSSDSWSDKLSTFQTVRTNLHLLCKPILEDLIDPSSFRSKRDIDSEKSLGAVATLDAFGIPVSGFEILYSTRRVNNATESILSLSTSEKNKMSLGFCFYLLSNAYYLFLDDEKKVRNEAMRVCAALLIHRNQYLFDLFNQRGRKGVDTVENTDIGSHEEIHEGFMRLIPDTVGSTTMYSKLLRQTNASFENEDKRFAEFSFWLTDNGALCDHFFCSFNSSSVVSTLSMSANQAIKDVLCEKVKLSSEYMGQAQQQNSLADLLLQSQCDEIIGEKREWLLYGISEVAAGALHWKNIWLCQQSCPIWGSAPVTTECSHFAIGGNEDSLELTFTPLDSSYELFSNINSWKLSNIGGPEKVCRRIEQDFETSLQDAAESRDEVSLPVEDSHNNNETGGDKRDASNIEDFLLKIAVNPLVRRVSTNTDGEHEDKLDEEIVEFQDDMDNDYDIEDDCAEDGNVHREDPTDMDVKNEESRHSDVDDNYLDGEEGLLVEAPEDYDQETDTDLRKLSFRNFTNSLSKKFQHKASRDKLAADLVDTTLVRRGGILVEILRGILGNEEWQHGQTLNVCRVNGLEARQALLVITPLNIHIIDGFQVNTNSNESDVVPVLWNEVVSIKETKKATILTPAEVVAAAVRQKNAPAASEGRSRANSKADNSVTISTKAKPPAALQDSDESAWLEKVWFQLLHADYGYFRMPLSKVYTIFKRRHELQNKALEVTDIYGQSLLFACESSKDCNATLKRLIEMNMPLSIFRKGGLKKLQMAGGGLFVYRRVTSYFMSSVTKLWQNGHISNFDYLMHLNIMAGRSFQDLTQYPVFPWIISDYESNSLDLENPKNFRDLSKPMGALGAKRTKQYQDRYQTMEEFYNEGIDEASPPYFYGTHYSCAGYVLYYMMRINPHARMAKTLQGGHFDTADRLFRAIESSWKSASEENLQDVRELIPEFYFLPDFLKNTNKFEFGETQKGEVVDDVILPAWAAGDPIEFIRKHRQALESRYVSEHLHLWIDLVFGYRQRGSAAKTALNLFMPLTYEGEVDIDSIEDPILRASTISQINNFGQTPARLFSKPHPKRVVPDVVKKATSAQEGTAYSVDSLGVQWHERMTPPLNIVCKSNHVWVSRISFQQASYPNNLKSGSPVGDVRLVAKDRFIAVPKGCSLLPPKFNKFIRYGKSGGGISIHSISPTARSSVMTNLDSGMREATPYEQLHPRMISCVAATKNGDMIVTGSTDRSVRVWSLERKMMEHHSTFIGHSGSILSLDICASFSLVVSGSEDRTAMVWDISSQPKLLHILNNHKGPVISVSINSICGHIATLTAFELRLYTVNGVLLSSVNFLDAIARMNNTKPAFKLKGKVVKSPPSGEWQDAVVAVTGHETGHVLLWKLSSEVSLSSTPSVQRELVPYALSQTHSSAISTINVCSSVLAKPVPFVIKPFDGENNYELLIGDVEGNVSRWSPSKIEHFSPAELQQALESGKISNM